MVEKWISWYRNLTFRRRVLVSYLAVSLIPVIILGAFSYFQTRNLLIRREKEVLQESLEQSVITVNSKLESYKNAMDNITWDANMKQTLAVRYEDNFQQYLAFRDVIDPTILKMKSLNPQIQQLSIYSSNPTLHPHGSYLMSVAGIEELPEDIEDYRIHWIADADGTLEMYCGIYPDISNDVNIVYMAFDYKATFNVLTRVFQENYGVVVADSGQKPIFSYADFTGMGEGEALTPEEVLAQKEGMDGYLLEQNTIPVSGWTVYLYRPLKVVSASAMSITFAMAAVICLCIGIILAASVGLTRSVVRPLNNLIENMDRIQEGNLSVDVKGDSDDEIGHLINRFGEMVERLNYLVNEVYKSKIAQQRYEMKALQAQINPHFLYNSLSLINWKAIMAGQDEISEMAQLLSTFYRTTLNKGKNVTAVQGEWDNTCSYIRIQNMMHSGKLQVHTEIEEGMLQYEMLNLLLQPLVENAIGHGLDYRTGEGEKILSVTGREEASQLVFTVCDNGCGIPQEVLETILTAKTSGYGVQNVQHRIQLYYGNEYGLSYESRVGEGTRVTLRIPKVEREEPKETE